MSIQAKSADNPLRHSNPQSPVQESPEDVLNPLAIYRMARTALHDMSTRGSSSKSPSTIDTASPGTFQYNVTRRQSYRNSHLPGLQLIPGQEHLQQSQLPRPSDRSAVIHSFDNAPLPSTRPEVPLLNTNNFPQFPAFATTGSWDPAEMAVMNMLDDGIAPWTAEYLTDGQSGVDPFLFPF
jgi:hypothetical protein